MSKIGITTIQKPVFRWIIGGRMYFWNWQISIDKYVRLVRSMWVKYVILSLGHPFGKFGLEVIGSFQQSLDLLLSDGCRHAQLFLLFHYPPEEVKKHHNQTMKKVCFPLLIWSTTALTNDKPCLIQNYIDSVWQRQSLRMHNFCTLIAVIKFKADTSDSWIQGFRQQQQLSCDKNVLSHRQTAFFPCGDYH